MEFGGGRQAVGEEGGRARMNEKILDSQDFVVELCVTDSMLLQHPSAMQRGQLPR